MTARRLGIDLAIVGFVAAQFVEKTLVTAGAFDFTAEKLFAIVLLPSAILLIGRLRLHPELVVLALLTAVAYSAAYVVDPGRGSTTALTLDASLAIGLLAAGLLYTALVAEPWAYHRFARIWIAFATVSALLAVLQAVGLAPLWLVPQGLRDLRIASAGHLYRGAGLNDDPNYEALLLVVAVVMVRYGVRRHRTILLVILFAGILATFSRMGVIVAAAACLGQPVLRAWRARRPTGAPAMRAVGLALIFVALSAFAAVTAPTSAARYANSRFRDLSTAYKALGWSKPDPRAGLTSTEERVVLQHEAVRQIIKHPVSGVGGEHISGVMAGTVGISKSVHNSYLELLTAGGLFGLLALGKYYVTVRRSLRRSDQPDDSAEHLQTRVEITAVVGAVAVMALFLTLNYSSIFWLPAVLVLACRYRSAPVEAEPPIR